MHSETAFSPGVRYMLLSTLALSVMFMFVKALDRIPVVELVLFRCAISLALCVASLRRQGVSVWGKNRKVLTMRGLFGTVGLMLSFLTMQRMPLGSAQTVIELNPIFTILIAWLLLGERIHPVQWAFFLIIFAGVAMIKGFDPRVSWVDLSVGLGAAFFIGCAYACIRLLKGSEHPLVIVFYFPFIAAPTAALCTFFPLAWFPWADAEAGFWLWKTPQGMEWLQLLGVGLFTQISQVYLTKALQVEAANRVTVVRYVGVPYALLFGYLFFGEAVGGLAAAGIALVLGGVLLNVSTDRIVARWAAWRR